MARSISAPTEHLRSVERLLGSARDFTIFDLETSDRLTGTHGTISASDRAEAAIGASRGGHAARYPIGGTPAWARARFGDRDEPKSGFGVPTGKVMQIAARRYRWAGEGAGELVEELNLYVNDPDLLPCCLAPSALATHRISIERTRAEGVSPRAAWGRFLRMAEGSVLMGQNIIDFDIPFTNSELARHSIPASLDPAAAIDVLLVAREAWSLSSNRLRALADRFGVKTDAALDHDALGDIDTCWQVWLAMQPGLRSYRERFLPAKGVPDQYRGRLGRLGSAWPKIPDQR
jgi:DNA polymerase III epsilon subunit-like protein